MGAVLSVSFDTLDMGQQAGEMALKILHAPGLSTLPPEEVRKVVVQINEKAAKILGVAIREPGNRE